MISWVNDNLGVKKSLIIGFTISAISSIIVENTTSKTILYITIFAIYPFGTSMGIPMLTVAIKRYTTLKRRGFAFGLYYSVMNMAALLSGPIIDLFNIGLKDGIVIGKLYMSGNRLVICTCTLSNLISLWIAVKYIRDIKIKEDNENTMNGEGDDDILNQLENSQSPSDHSNLRITHNPLANLDNNDNCNDFKPKYTIGTDSDDGSNENENKSHLNNNLNNNKDKNKEEEDDDDDDDRSDDNDNDKIVLMKSKIYSHQTNSSSKYKSFSISQNDDSDGENDDFNNTIDSKNNSSCNDNNNHQNHNTNNNNNANEIEEFKPIQQNPYNTIKELCTSLTFWRFSILTLFLINLNAIFRHLDATLPTYLVRCFGKNVPKGTLYSINPFMIIFLTPFVAMVTCNYNHFDMIKWGGYLTGISPFFPAMSTSIWAVVLMNIFLSLGEAIWSPRLYDYVMTISPEVLQLSFITFNLISFFSFHIMLCYDVRERKHLFQH